jgi:hypothetical protein
VRKGGPRAARLSFPQEACKKERIGSHIGGIGNVVNTVVRMFTRKAVGKAMKSPKSASGNRTKDGPENSVGPKAVPGEREPAAIGCKQTQRSSGI